MTNEFTELEFDLLKVLQKHKKLPEGLNLVIKHEEIRQEYFTEKKNGGNGRVIRENLANKYFTSVKNIEKILYNKK